LWQTEQRVVEGHSPDHLRGVAAVAECRGARQSTARNPAAKLGNEFRLVPSTRQRQDQVKAFDEPQLQAFMTATKRVSPAYLPLFATLAGAGLRLGEALGLQWADLNIADSTIHVQRTMAPDGQAGVPKSGHGRVVAMSEQLSRLPQGSRFTEASQPTLIETQLRESPASGG
jgi:integrase